MNENQREIVKHVEAQRDLARGHFHAETRTYGMGSFQSERALSKLVEWEKAVDVLRYMWRA